jgi:hypothetical protein
MPRKQRERQKSHRKGSDARKDKSNSPGAIIPKRLSGRNYAAYSRALKVLSLTREGESLTAASRRVGISPPTVLRYLPEDFKKARGSNRYLPSKSDRNTRFINLLLSDGQEHTLRVQGSRQAKLASDYSNALQRYLAGDTLALRPFRGKTISGRTLLTDPKKIKEIGERGVEVDHFYAEVVG